MALHFDLTGISDHENICYYKNDGNYLMEPTTKTIIFYMMAIEVSKITADNIPEVFARISTLEKLLGTSLSKGFDENGVRIPVYITLDDVCKHEGLITNASNSSRTEFLKKCKDWIKRDIDEIFSQTKKKLVEKTAISA